MDAKERIFLLLDEFPHEEIDALSTWWDTASETFPVRALWLLLRVADQDGTWLYSPIAYHLEADGTDKFPLSHIMNLSPVVVADMHFMMHMEDMGLLAIQEAPDGEMTYMLTPHGAFAVAFWLDSMSDLSIRHDSLPTLSQWLLRSSPSTMAS